jgi:hypothetical protein
MMFVADWQGVGKWFRYGYTTGRVGTQKLTELPSALPLKICCPTYLSLAALLFDALAWIPKNNVLIGSQKSSTTTRHSTGESSATSA